MDNFSLFILEITSTKNVIAREQFYFDKYNPELNILPKAGNSLGRKHIPETKERISKSLTGRKYTLEAIENYRKAALGRTYSLETIEKIRASAPAFKVEVLELKTNIKTVYKSIMEAGRALDSHDYSL
jgi:group I intron endonuclease